jgi:hypothetical protein
MYCLEAIKAINARAVKKHERETTREPSVCVGIGGALIVHSATLRSTGYLAPGKTADAFRAAFARCKSRDERNALVDSIVP